MAIDSHMHINSIVLDNKEKYINEIINNKSIECVINVGLNIETSKECIEINRERKFYSSIGIHPLYINSQEINKLYELASKEKVIAIGEIGLDSNRNNYEEQKIYLIKQIIIANELHLPVIIHSNNTNKIIIEIFEKYKKPKYGCVFHCFQPDMEDLNYLIENGYYISFAGKITYKTAKKSIEVLKMVPNDLFLIETDSPYFSPEPFRNEINRTDNIKYIIKKISEVKNLSYEEIDKITTNNTKRLFKKIKKQIVK